MSFRAFISRRLSAWLLDESRLQRARARAETRRRKAGEPHRIEHFHQVDDPYSYLLAATLLQLRKRYEVEIRIWLVGPPDDWAAPERQRLRDYSLLDARRLSVKAGIPLERAEYPDVRAVTSSLRHLVDTLPSPAKPGDSTTLESAVNLGRELWCEGDGGFSENLTATEADVESALQSGGRRREALGHYLGGTCWYSGEWFWGIDRLHYLEAWLRELGAERRDGHPTNAATDRRSSFEPPQLLAGPIDAQARALASLPDLHFFLSFRSPYTSIVIDRAIALADAFDVELRLRFVLPMVMRGLPVKRTKRSYILRDTGREARRLGVPFGPVADPVGKPVERGYSLIPWAIEQGRGREYCRSFLKCVWSEGVDAGSDRGLARIVESAGLDWTEGRRRLGDDSWRTQAEANRQELLALGLWGVPSFRVGDVAVWGQDRLWVLEDEYRRLLTA